MTKTTYTFAWKDIVFESPTVLDKRKVLCGNGMIDLLNSKRGSLDYLDGKWRGTNDNIEVIATLPKEMTIQTIGMGFLSHHRSGIVYPESVELYIGSDKEHLTLYQTIQLPNQPCEREIAKTNVVLSVNQSIGAFRFVAKRYKLMPDWCFYHGTPNVFTMADNLIIVPKQ